MGALLAWGVGHRPAGIVAVAATILATQLAVGWTNDWLDAGRDTTAARDDKPVANGQINRSVVGVAGLVAAAATPALGMVLNPTAALWITLALLSALLYNWPLKFTPASVVPYAFSFGVLPAFVVLALPGAPTPPVWMVAAGALLGAGGHFANVLPDLAHDARTGVRGLPHRLGPTGARAATLVLLAAATAVLTLGPSGPPSWTGLTAMGTTVVLLLAGWYAARPARGEDPVRRAFLFQAVLLVAVIDVALLVASGRVR